MPGTKVRRIRTAVNLTKQAKASVFIFLASLLVIVGFVFFFVSVLINSQGAVVVAFLPLAYQLGIAGPVLLGVLPSVYGYFFIPNYPSDIALANPNAPSTPLPMKSERTPIGPTRPPRSLHPR